MHIGFWQNTVFAASNLVLSDDEVDLAAVRCPTAPGDSAYLEVEPALPTLGAPVHTLGFPGTASVVTPVMSTFSVASIEMQRGKVHQLVLSGAINKGNSGGALCNAAGKVGVIVRKYHNTRRR